jgi:hypothetical protein
MRKALNDNPTVQIAVIAVLVVAVGMFMMTNLKKGSGGSTGSAGAPATSASASPGATAGTTAPVPVPGTAAPAVGSAVAPPATSGTVPPEALLPGPGLPRPVVAAWKGGHAVVLLVTRRSGIDDRLVRGSVESLSGEPNVSVFVTPAEDVARYSRITQGVGVNRVPALVVVRPRHGSAVPEAQVSYGFRNSQSVVQAVHDALYTGHDNLPYYPR